MDVKFPVAKKDIFSGAERKSKRFKTKEKATIKIEGQKAPINVIVGNLSETGASLDLKQGSPLPKKGEIITMIMTLSNLKKTYNISAEVMWVKYTKIGIRFMSKREVVK
jgi:c-di-GMP-binding flagellar brake protein YcgR